MKKTNIVLLLILFANLVQAQNSLLKKWDYRFGGTSTEVVSYFQQTKDGGYILGGSSNSGIGGDKTQDAVGSSDYWIVKIDSLGSKQWDKDFGGISSDVLCSLQQTTDGGYIIGGQSLSGVGGDKTMASWGSYDYWILKIDSLGNKQWDKDFGGTNSDLLYSLQQTKDGGYILGGYSQSGIGGDKTQPVWGTAGFDGDYWIIKTDSLGNKQWDKDFGGTSNDELISLLQTVDSGYILGGYSLSMISGDKTQTTWGDDDYWIIKIDSLGNKQWDKDFGGNYDDVLFSLQQTTDRGYILGGLSHSGIYGDKTQANWDTSGTTQDYWIVKTDSLGNKQWDKDFGGVNAEDDFGNISKTNDGGYLIAGSSYSNISGDKTENNLGTEQSWIVKIDSLGNKQWDKTLHTFSHDEIGLAIQTSNGCYSMANYTFGGIGGDKTQGSQGNYDYWIIKFCDTTSTTSINQIANSQIQISIYPNPANSILNVSVNNKENILITNLLGEIVLQKNFSSNTKGKIEVDVSFLSVGIYFIKVGNKVSKFVKE